MFDATCVWAKRVRSYRGLTTQTHTLKIIYYKHPLTRPTAHIWGVQIAIMELWVKRWVGAQPDITWHGLNYQIEIKSLKIIVLNPTRIIVQKHNMLQENLSSLAHCASNYRCDNYSFFFFSYEKNKPSHIEYISFENSQFLQLSIANFVFS